MCLPHACFETGFEFVSGFEEGKDPIHLSDKSAVVV
jgi:hypothetical protein